MKRLKLNIIYHLFYLLIIILIMASCSFGGDLDAWRARAREANLANVTITFDTNGGNSIDVQTIKSGEKAVKPAAPIKSGYTFINWYSDSALTVVYDFNTPVTNSITVYAKWDEVPPGSCLVSFIANGGTPAPSQQTVILGGKVTPPSIMIRDDYAFDGWYRENTFNTRWDFNTDTISDHITLYARWVLISETYKVVYDKNAGDATGTMADSYFPLGTVQPLSANDFTRSGYSFSGWGTIFSGPAVYGNQSNVIDLADIGRTIILYAQWTANTYTVAYNANGGSGNMGNVTHTYGTAKNLEIMIFTRTNYTFMGWAMESDGSVIYSNQQSVTNLSAELGAIVTLYAQWNANTASIDISVADIEDASVGTISNGLVLSRSGTKSTTITIQDGSLYNGGIEWIYNGETLGTGANITLNVDPVYSGHNYVYNFIGKHLLTIKAVKDGILYTVRVEFEVTL